LSRLVDGSVSVAVLRSERLSMGEEEKGKRECWLKGVWLELIGRTNERAKEMISPLSRLNF